jgi:hypothetical protein
MPDQPYGLGAIPSPFDPDDYTIAMLAPAAAPPAPPMPGAVPGPIPGPLNQGETGTCVANGITGAANILFHRKLGRWLFNEASAQDLYLRATGDTTLKKGTYPRLVLKYAQKVGILGTDGKRYKIGPYHSLLPSANLQADIEQVIGVLGLPVVFAISWPQAWMGKGAPVLPDVTPSDPSAGGHAFYGFRYALKHPVPGSSAVTHPDDGFMNSWGLLFGLDGWAWASAGVLTGRAFDVWTFTV